MHQVLPSRHITSTRQQHPTTNFNRKNCKIQIMFCQCRATVTRNAKQALSCFDKRTLAPLTTASSSGDTMNHDDYGVGLLDAIFKQKHSLRSKIRKQLKNMDPIRKSEEDNAIQNLVLEAPWFKASKSLCAYISCPALREVDTSRIVSETLSTSIIEGNTQIRKKLYVPRVEDMNSNMRMLKISRVGDLVKNSMNILEPEFVDCDGNQREDGMLRKAVRHAYLMQTSEPIDLLILPGLAFDRSGRRLGRSGGYYDLFLKKYREHANTKDWKQPLLVALSYSVQLLDEGSIPVTPFDVPVDAIVTPDGCIPTSPVTFTTRFN